MPVAFILRRLFLATLLTVPQVFWLGKAWRLVDRPKISRFLRWTTRFLILVAAVSMVLVLWDRISTRFLPERITYYIAPVVQLWIFTSTFVFFLIKTLHALVWIWTRLASLFTPAGSRKVQDPTRRSLLHHAASIVGGMPFVAALYGYSVERLRFEIVRVNIPIPNLAPALNGLRIAQLSDIHVGDFMPLHEVRRAVAMANDLAPHLSVITGDFVTSAGDPLAECIGELSLLRAPLGVWGCNGNHEIYAGAEDQAESLFHLHEMRLLRQSAAQLQWNGAPLNLIGIDYQRNIRITGKGMPTLGAAEALIRRDMPNILLSHNPNTFYRAAALGIELSLAGHTHGGQVNVEILNNSLNPARFMTDFVSGLYHLPMPDTSSTRFRQASLYVNRGVGTLGLPARIGANPEITLLTLRSATC